MRFGVDRARFDDDLLLAMCERVMSRIDWLRKTQAVMVPTRHATDRQEFVQLATTAPARAQGCWRCIGVYRMHARPVDMVSDLREWLDEYDEAVRHGNDPQLCMEYRG